MAALPIFLPGEILWTEEPGRLPSMGSQRIGHDWAQHSMDLNAINIQWLRLHTPSAGGHGLQPTRLLCPWDFPGKNTGVGYYFLPQGIFLTRGLNPSFLCFLHWQADSLPLPYLGSPWTVSNICFSTPEVRDRSDKVNITSSFHVASVSPLDTVDLPVLKGTVTRKEDYSTFRGNQGRKISLVPRGY